MLSHSHPGRRRTPSWMAQVSRGGGGDCGLCRVLGGCGRARAEASSGSHRTRLWGPELVEILLVSTFPGAPSHPFPYGHVRAQHERRQ